MLLKHSAQYLLARGLPGFVNFLAIALYTRMLSPDEYGRYALVIASVSLFNVVFFQWLRLALTRFLPAYLDNPKPLCSTVLASFSVLALITGGLGLLLAWLWPDPVWHGLILVAVPLLWAEAWFELNLSLSAVKLLPLRYGLMNGVKAVSSLLVGAALIIWGMGAYGPLFGLLLGVLLASSIWDREEWSGFALSISKPILREIMHYGLPLTATFALTFVVSSSDRFIIAGFLGEGPAGVYSASYDLAQQSLALMMTILNLSAFPLILQTLKNKGTDAARLMARDSTTLLLATAVPSAAAFVFFSPLIAEVCGKSFRHEAESLLPIIAIASLIAGIKMYHFDRAFHLSTKTWGQIWVSLGSALANILLNWAWIPSFGLIGAAYATLAAYIFGLALSFYIGRRLFVLIFPWKEAFLIFLATGIAVVLLMFIRYSSICDNYIIQAMVAGVLYLLLIWLFNIADARKRSLKLFDMIGW